MFFNTTLSPELFVSLENIGEIPLFAFVIKILLARTKLMTQIKLTPLRSQELYKDLKTISPERQNSHN